MKKVFVTLRDTFIAGIIFLLPLLVLFVLLTKVFQFLTGFTNKIAGLFGLTKFAGISGGTIVSTIGLIIVCLLCGYLVKISFFRSVSKWVDKKMMTHIPGYSVYREMAMSKLEAREETLPYKTALWLKKDNFLQPGFLMDYTDNGKLIVFIPTAGNVKEGNIFTVDDTDVMLSEESDMKAFKNAISNLGIGLNKTLSKKQSLDITVPV
ncbi:hypothetical protein [Pollutibacter soli]|uniref:hypothetical protein n=1 Tax=Pollutibacter soli TaxID=3034157 RepID=UPI003014074F